MERFIYDGHHKDGKNTYYYFACNDANIVGEIFESFCEEDIDQYIVDRFEGDYNLIGCTISLIKNSETQKITEKFLAALIEYDEGFLELEPITLELTEEQTNNLLNKIEEGDE